MYLLDTNTLSYFFRGEGQVAQRLYAQPPALIKIPAIVIFELEYGLQRAAHPAKFRPQIDWILRTFAVLPLDQAAAQAAALARHKLEQIGAPIGLADLQIAGIGIGNNLIVVTRNTREFSRVPGLRVEDWFE